MILYDFSQPLSTLWWMHGSVVPSVLWVSLICGLNGVIGVFFKDEYNLYVTDTSHSMIGTAVALVLVFKCGARPTFEERTFSGHAPLGRLPPDAARRSEG